MNKLTQYLKSKTNLTALVIIFVGQLQNQLGLYEHELGTWFQFVTAFIGSLMVYLRSLTVESLSEK